MLVMLTTLEVYQGRATSANWADLAEKYEADVVYEEGDIVGIGGEKEITLYKKGMALAGIISMHPGVRMNVTEENMEDPLWPFVALKGRVNCKINGTAKKGDYIIADDNGKGIACPIGLADMNSMFSYRSCLRRWRGYDRSEGVTCQVIQH